MPKTVANFGPAQYAFANLYKRSPIQIRPMSNIAIPLPLFSLCESTVNTFFSYLTIDISSIPPSSCCPLLVTGKRRQCLKHMGWTLSAHPVDSTPSNRFSPCPPHMSSSSSSSDIVCLPNQIHNKTEVQSHMYVDVLILSPPSIVPRPVLVLATLQLSIWNLPFYENQPAFHRWYAYFANFAHIRSFPRNQQTLPLEEVS